MLAAMTTPSAQSLEAGSSGYGLGLSVRTLSGVACYGHGGFWGVVVWHCPSVDIAIAGFVTNTAGRDLLSAMIEDAAATVRH